MRIQPRRAIPHALSLIALALALYATPAAAQSLSAEFDWTMPERFAVPAIVAGGAGANACLLYTSPSPRD